MSDIGPSWSSCHKTCTSDTWKQGMFRKVLTGTFSDLGTNPNTMYTVLLTSFFFVKGKKNMYVVDLKSDSIFSAVWFWSTLSGKRHWVAHRSIRVVTCYIPVFYLWVTWHRSVCILLTLYLICQFWTVPIQQQIKIWCQKYGQMGAHLSYLADILWEKKKWLITSHFFSFHNVFKSCLLLMHQNEYLWSKGLS